MRSKMSSRSVIVIKQLNPCNQSFIQSDDVALLNQMTDDLSQLKNRNQHNICFKIESRILITD